jgi:hypothetical protein
MDELPMDELPMLKLLASHIAHRAHQAPGGEHGAGPMIGFSVFADANEELQTGQDAGVDLPSDGPFFGAWKMMKSHEFPQESDGMGKSDGDKFV